MKVSFVIPTLNEHGNITRLIQKINEISIENNLHFEIIIVDDNSTDGTINDVQILQKSLKNLNLIVRKRPQGIGSAHIVGYNNAKGDLIISMDADLSHPPEKIPDLIKEIKKGYDIVIGSRYMKGAISDKSVFYRFLSMLGSFYLSLMFRIKLTDFSNGFRAIKNNIWNQISNYKYSNENTFLVESLYFAFNKGARVGEIPASFSEREIGESKTHLFKESLKAIFLPFQLKFRIKKIFL